MADKVKVILDKADDIIRLPAIALRGLVAFPGNVIHFEVGRKKSVAAIEWAIHNKNLVFLTAQKEMDTQDPGMKELFQYGVIAQIKQVLRISDDLVKVLVEGKDRAKMLAVDTTGHFLQAAVKPMPLTMGKSADPAAADALMRTIKELFEAYLAVASRLSKEVAYQIMTCDDPEKLCDYAPANLMLKYQDKQRLLDEGTLIGRMEKLAQILHHETKVLRLEREIQTKVNEQLDKNQREYYLREQMRQISDELGDYEDTAKEAEEYRKKIADCHLSEESTEKLLKEANRLSKMQSSSQEATVIRSYLDTCLSMPWNVQTQDRLDVKKAQQELDRAHFGMKKVKERILELLAVRKLAPDVKGQIICLAGPPGVGKTSIAKSIADCLDRKYVRISLGGVRDESEIRGHRRTYIGAMPGKIVNAILTAKSSNPLILLDEVDKMSNDFRGDPSAALLEVLDPEQNVSFKDHYLDLPFDLSNVLFLTTANNLSTIPRPLLDRMEVIELPSYTRNEKLQIAKKHLLPKQLKMNGLKGKVKISNPALSELIDGYTKEAGVRNLERVITRVLRKCAKEIAQEEAERISVDVPMIETLLGPRKIKESFFSRTDEVGVANGLAWTSVGGEVLPIEVQKIPSGSGRIELTGTLGDVMKESAKIAITYAKVHAKEYGIDQEVFKNHDFHIHAPEGAVPKDGPSAGITLTTALISCLSEQPVRCDVAMTGEITLHGKVLPIGGLKEKSMAAYKEGAKLVLIPKGNEPDLYEIDEEVRSKLTFQPVYDLSEVLKTALVRIPAFSSSEISCTDSEQTKTGIVCAQNAQSSTRITP